LQRTAELTPAKLEDDITNLRKQIQNHLDTVLGRLNDEGKKLNDIRSAIEIESKRLSETRDINLAVTSLRALIEEYDAKAKELQTNYKNMEENITGTYRHFKGSIVEVLGVALHTETKEEMVVYVHPDKIEGYEENSMWVRPKEMFFGEKEVDGVMVPRFVKIEE